MTLTWASLYTNQVLTRTQFITRLRTRLDEDAEDFIQDVQVESLIEDGLRDISRRTGMYKTYCSSAADGSEHYSLPVDLAKLDMVEYDNASGDKKILIKTNPDEVQCYAYGANPTHYLRDGNTIRIYGNPVNGTIKVHGTKVPTLPATDESFIDIPQQYLEILYAWCEWKYWTRRRSPDEAKLASDTYFQIIQEISDEIQVEFESGVSMYGQFQE